jgi:hypothetical protein
MYNYYKLNKYITKLKYSRNKSYYIQKINYYIKEGGGGPVTPETFILSSDVYNNFTQYYLDPYYGQNKKDIHDETWIITSTQHYDLPEYTNTCTTDETYTSCINKPLKINNECKLNLRDCLVKLRKTCLADNNEPKVLLTSNRDPNMSTIVCISTLKRIYTKLKMQYYKDDKIIKIIKELDIIFQHPFIKFWNNLFKKKPKPVKSSLPQNVSWKSKYNQSYYYNWLIDSRKKNNETPEEIEKNFSAYDKYLLLQIEDKLSTIALQNCITNINNEEYMKIYSNLQEKTTNPSIAILEYIRNHGASQCKIPNFSQLQILTEEQFNIQQKKIK